jgi:hypothetical protein
VHGEVQEQNKAIPCWHVNARCRPSSQPPFVSSNMRGSSTWNCPKQPHDDNKRTTTFFKEGYRSALCLHWPPWGFLMFVLTVVSLRSGSSPGHCSPGADVILPYLSDSPSIAIHNYHQSLAKDLRSRPFSPFKSSILTLHASGSDSPMSSTPHVDNGPHHR